MAKLNYFLTLVIVVVAMLAILIIYSQWGSPSNIIALGSILAASISTITLVYTLVHQSNAVRREAILKFADFLPHSKKVLSVDIERIIYSCSGTKEFSERNKSLVMEPDSFLLSILNDEAVCENLSLSYKNEDEIVLRAAVQRFIQRYEQLETEATENGAEAYFNIIIRDIGYRTFYNMFGK